MPTGQQYATNVPQTTLTGLINPTATLMSVNSSSGWPATPFTAILEIGTSLQEPIDVTNVTGTTWTIVRAIDGTTGFTHNPNATVTHGDIGRDFREARTHMDATTAQHGLGGGVSFVGDTTTQSLSNKTIVSGVYSGAQSMGSGAWTGTGTLTEAALAFSGLTGATFQTTRIVGTVSTGAAPVSGTFALGDMIYDTFYQMLWVCTSAGTPGTWRPMGNQAVQITTAAGTLNVPAWANTIKLSWAARQSTAATGGVFLDLRFNADSGSNYVWEYVQGSNATVTSANSGGLTTGIHIGIIPQGNDTANYQGAGELTICNAQGSNYKAVSSRWNGPLTATNLTTGTAGGLWQNTAAITSLTILPNTGSFNGGSNMTATFSS